MVDVSALDAKVDHVAIAVRDMRAAIPFYVDGLGARFLFSGERGDQGFRWAQFAFDGGGKIELVTPLSADGFVARFLDRRGEGVHHVTLKVPDIFQAVEHLGAQGIPLINVHTDDPGWREAFIHPTQANGTLIQLAQSPYSDEQMAQHHLEQHGDSDHRHLSLDDLLRLPSEVALEADRT